MVSQYRMFERSGIYICLHGVINTYLKKKYVSCGSKKAMRQKECAYTGYVVINMYASSSKVQAMLLKIISYSPAVWMLVIRKAIE